MTSQNVRDLARRMHTLKKTQAATTSVPQLASSSVENGAIDHYDAAGQLVARIGQQHDGTTAAATLAGPVPPAPLGVDADGGQLTVTAKWDGTFVDGQVAPMDFTRVEVHRGTSQDFVPDPLPTSSTRVGSIEHTGGGSFTWTEQPGEVWVTMITRSASGKASEPIARVMVEVRPAVDPEVFEQAARDLNDARSRLSAAESGLTAAHADLYDAGGRVDVLKSTLSGQITAGDSATATAAAADATSKADAARTSAVSTAAADATSKTAAVRAETLSRGTDLVTNGTGALGTNYNFTAFTEFSTSDTPSGTYRSWSDPSGARNRYLDETISIDVTKAYTLSAWVKQAGTSTTSLAYLAIAPVDQYGLTISPSHTAYIAGTTTTLASDLKPGDTTMKLADPTNWYGTAGKPAGASITYRRGIIPWNYVDAGGKAWPAQTYSRNTLFDLWDDGGIAADGTVTLKKPWAGRLIPAGTPLSNSDAGNNLIYPAIRVIKPAEGWVRLVGTPVAGTVTDGRIPDTAKAWPPGTAACRIAVLENYTNDTTNSKHMWAGFSLSDATAAYNQAVSATSKADAAQVVANTAKSSADTAKSAADTAQSTANTAKADAAAAAGIANGKGDVLIQPAAPAAAMQKATTLWIDTTNSVNAPKRWSGSAWVVVTDKAATDAASAAAAAQATANTAKAAADTADAKAVQAQNTATQARADAATAKGAADAAQVTASGKNTVLWNTTDPDTSNGAATNTRAGDIWNRYQLVNNKLMILATWQSDGTRWNPSGLAETYLPQVNIGTGTYGELDGLRLKAKSVQAGAVLVDGSVGRVLIADGAITAAKADINDLAAATGAIINLDVGQLVVTESSTFSTAVAQRMFVDVFAANKVTANELDAASVAAAVGVFVRVKAEQLDSGFLNASIGIGTSGAIMAGDWSKSYARIDDKGFSTWMVAEDGTQYMATSLGSATTNSLTIADSAGVTRASISPDGDVAATSVTVADDVSIAGADLIGQRLPYAGSSGASWLDTLPWALAGISNMGKTVAGRSVTAAASEVLTPLQVVTATVWPGRSYQVTMPYAYYVRSVSSSAAAYLGVRAYYTVGSQTAPTPADPSASGGGVGYSIRAHSVDVGPVADNLVFTITPSVDAGGPVQMKVMVASSVKNATMAYSVPTGGSWLLAVQDIGPAVPDTGYPVGGPSVSQFVSQWKASVSRSFDKNGADSNADYQQGILRHGGDALTHSAFVCNDPAFFGEKGKTIAQALTGATVTKVEIGVQSLYWSSATGGTLTLLPLGATSIAATDTSPGDPKKGVEKKFTTRSQWQWVTVPTSWITPTSTGVRLGPTWFYGATNQSYFANHRHPSAPPQIRITYMRADAS